MLHPLLPFGCCCSIVAQMAKREMTERRKCYCQKSTQRVPQAQYQYSFLHVLTPNKYSGGWKIMLGIALEF